MITISTIDYTTNQLKYLAYGLVAAGIKILKRNKCEFSPFCSRKCKDYAICNDILTHGVTCTIR
jgi:hypothetical protein|nr:MAG TPA: DNA gyrase inhibitor [Caudoviricetes sp.]